MHPRHVILLTLLSATSALAQPVAPDPDWPCQQRLIPTLQPGSYWSGPPVPTDYGWRDDTKLAALVANAVDRDTPQAEAEKSLSDFADALPPDQRVKMLPMLFGAVVGETNDQRDLVVGRIKQLAERQTSLSRDIATLTSQADAIPDTDAARRDDLASQRDFKIQAFQETQRTMRYACDVPSTMERRLGQLARVLMSRLGKG